MFNFLILLAVLLASQQITATACTLEAQQTHLFRSNKSFARVWEQCGRDSWGSKEESAQCILAAYPTLGENCANCFGEYTGCAKSNCWFKCAFGSAKKCEHCAQENCLESLAQCTGVESKNIPSKHIDN